MKVQLSGGAGYLFMAHGVEAPCFVPDALVHFDANGRPSVDQLAYVREGWSLRNMRFADVEDGCAHLFPDESRPIEDGASPLVVPLLERCRRHLAAAAS